MCLNQIRGERHILLESDTTELNDDTIQQIQKNVLNFWEEEAQNVILDLPNLEEEDSGKFGFLNDLAEQAMEAGCSFVLSQGNQALKAYADENEISYAPSRNEAIDLVFIESLERGFNEEE
jgi:ABC-type transporter Mla MlaB component